MVGIECFFSSSVGQPFLLSVPSGRKIAIAEAPACRGSGSEVRKALVQSAGVVRIVISNIAVQHQPVFEKPDINVALSLEITVMSGVCILQYDSVIILAAGKIAHHFFVPSQAPG